MKCPCFIYTEKAQRSWFCLQICFVYGATVMTTNMHKVSTAASSNLCVPASFCINRRQEFLIELFIILSTNHINRHRKSISQKTLKACLLLLISSNFCFFVCVCHNSFCFCTWAKNTLKRRKNWFLYNQFYKLSYNKHPLTKRIKKRDVINNTIYLKTTPT